jgi:hypothetical protein
MLGTFLNMNLILTRRMTALPVLLASILLTACGLRSTNSSSETLTVYEDAPTLTHLDLGPPGNSPGRRVSFFRSHYALVRAVRSRARYLAQKRWSSSRPAPNFEKRATLLFFTFGEHQDQIIALGVHDYSPTAAEFNAGKSVVGTILGGTGKIHGRAWPIGQYAEC